MKRSTVYVLMATEAIISVILAAFLPPEAQTGGYVFIAQFPFAQIGRLLRILSLSGAAGNILAFALYASLCAAPWVWAVLRILKKRFQAEDVLLWALGGFSFYMMFLMINPSYFPGAAALSAQGMVQAVLGGVFYSMLIGYAGLRLLRKTNDTTTDKLLKLTRLLLGVMAAALVLHVAYLRLHDLLAQIRSVQAGNTDPAVSLGATYVFLTLRYILESLPDAMEVILFLMAMGLCEKLISDRYSEAVISAARDLAAYCGKMVVTVLIGTLVYNLLQLLFAGALVDVSFYTLLPLESLAFAFAMMLLARLLSDGRKLREDNELII